VTYSDIKSDFGKTAKKRNIITDMFLINDIIAKKGNNNIFKKNNIIQQNSNNLYINNNIMEQSYYRTK
jgi:hypothetical protein